MLRETIPLSVMLFQNPVFGLSVRWKRDKVKVTFYTVHSLLYLGFIRQM